MWRNRARVVLLALFVLTAFSRSLSAQGPPGAAGPPPPNGEQLYNENCVECHGPDGDSIADVDIGHGRFRRATNDPELIGIVLRGIPGTSMPPHSFSEAQAAAIVSFLRAKATRAASSAGNAASGQAIFSGKGNCQSCHRVGATGSRVGPDLSEIGRLRHSTDIERAILEPDAMILPSNRFIRVAMKDGSTINGRMLNQDIFTVQLIDMKEQLRTIQRSEVRELTFIDKSSMPSYQGKLSTQEVADLVSYLVSLRGGGTP
jgi:putative heme-binding domain-containing protein